VCVPSGPTCAVCCSFQWTFAGCALVHLCIHTGSAGVARSRNGREASVFAMKDCGFWACYWMLRTLRSAHPQELSLVSKTSHKRKHNTTRLTHYKLPVSNIVSPSIKLSHIALDTTDDTFPSAGRDAITRTSTQPSVLCPLDWLITHNLATVEQRQDCRHLHTRVHTHTCFAHPALIRPQTHSGDDELVHNHREAGLTPPQTPSFAQPTQSRKHIKLQPKPNPLPTKPTPIRHPSCSPTKVE
jgi:hypothetical protein